ncbi:RNA polymerase sigma factor [Streptosporangium sandarakinum]
MEDVTVVERSLDDPELFSLLYDRYFTEIYRYLAARLGGEQAEDLVADSFLLAFDGRRDFDPRRGSVRSWLWGRRHRRSVEHRRPGNRAGWDWPPRASPRRRRAGPGRAWSAAPDHRPRAGRRSGWTGSGPSPLTGVPSRSGPRRRGDRG